MLMFQHSLFFYWQTREHEERHLGEAFFLKKKKPACGQRVLSTKREGVSMGENKKSKREWSTKKFSTHWWSGIKETNDTHCHYRSI